MASVEQVAGAEPEYAYDAFVSHANADKARVDEIVRKLEEHGLRCWIAPRDMRPGSEYGADIIRGIRQSRSLIVFLSPNSITSRHVRSEVERAATLKRSIYPVRLSDIEMGDALQFFLSIHQRVDLFTDEPSDTIEQLAYAIKSNAATDVVVQKIDERRRKKRLIRIAAGVAVAALAISALAFWPKPEPAVVQQVASGVTSSGQVISDASAEGLEAVEVKFEKWGNQIDVSMEWRNRGAGSETMWLEFNGQPAIPVSKYERYRADPVQKIVLLAADESGTVVSARDLSDLARNYFIDQHVLSLRATVEGDDKFTCNFYGCYFQEYGGGWLCSDAVKSAEITQGQQKKWTTIDRSAYCVNQETKAYVCLDHRDFSFALNTNDVFKLRMTYEGGRQEIFNIPVQDDEYYGDLAQSVTQKDWIMLEPIASRNPKGPAPLARAIFSPFNKIRIDSALGNCNGRNNFDVARSQQWQLDDDGRGLVDHFSVMNMSRHEENLSSVHEGWKQWIREGAQVGIALKVDDNQRLGPYWYKVDVKALVEKRVGENNTPKVQCSSGYSRFPRRCTATSLMDWVGVRRVAFGSSSDKLTSVVNLSYSIEDLFKPGCQHRAEECDPFRFTVPDGWTDVHYQVTGADGKKRPVERLRLN